MHATVAALLVVMTACDSGESERRGGAGDPDAAPDGDVLEGRVFVLQELIEPTVVAHANASFQPGARCDVETIDACTVCLVDLTAPLGDQTPLDAGVISLAGAELPADGIELAWDAELEAYGAFLGDAPLFDGGQTITASSAGGELPAWGEQSVETPGEIAVTAPDCSADDCVLDRSGDLEVTWTGGGAGDVEVSVSTTDNETAAVVVYCTFEATAHQGTVPAAAMAQLQQSDRETVFGQFLVAPTSAITFPVADWNVRFSVTTTRTFATFATAN